MKAIAIFVLITLAALGVYMAAQFLAQMFANFTGTM
jgi:hypothetical protein